MISDNIAVGLAAWDYKSLGAGLSLFWAHINETGRT